MSSLRPVETNPGQVSSNWWQVKILSKIFIAAWEMSQQIATGTLYNNDVQLDRTEGCDGWAYDKEMLTENTDKFIFLTYFISLWF